MLVGMPVEILPSHIRVSGMESQLCLLFQLSSSMYSGKQQGMIEVLVSLNYAGDLNPQQSAFSQTKPSLFSLSLLSSSPSPLPPGSFCLPNK